MELNRVPFGLDPKSGRFVDVASVPRGLTCGCVCPSCKAPLIARKGDVNEWHFAHVSRGASARPETACEFSFFVSARMMARQIIGRELTIALPAFSGSVQHVLEFGELIRVDFKVTEARVITLSEVSIDQVFSEVTVDVLGRVNQYSFLIYFTHPERGVPLALSTPSDPRCGAISISLESLPRRFREAGRTKRSYEDILREFLYEDTSGKTWIYHPLYRARLEEAQAELDARVSVGQQDCGFRRFSNVRPQPARFECVICGAVWTGVEPMDRDCPRCGTHLYTRVQMSTD